MICFGCVATVWELEIKSSLVTSIQGVTSFEQDLCVFEQLDIRFNPCLGAVGGTADELRFGVAPETYFDGLYMDTVPETEEPGR